MDEPRGPTGSGEPTDYLVVATIRRPHGVRGELSLSVETDRPRSVFRTGRVLQLGDARGRPLGRALTVARTRAVNDGILLVAQEFSSRTPEVDALRGLTLLIPGSESAPPAEDEVRYRDLVGSRVLVAGERIGTVRDVLETGGAELLVIQRSDAKELLVPFVKELIRKVDVERREVEIDPPEGLLDL